MQNNTSEFSTKNMDWKWVHCTFTYCMCNYFMSTYYIYLNLYVQSTCITTFMNTFKDNHCLSYLRRSIVKLFLIIIIITTTNRFKLPPKSYTPSLYVHITTGDLLVILFSNLAPSWPSSTTKPSLASFNSKSWKVIVISENYDCDWWELWLR